MKMLNVLMAVSIPASAFANGGGYAYGNSKLGSIGLFQPKNAEQVEMQTELLDIELGIERAKVTVEYTLRNPGKAVTVEAGFPITSEVDVNEDRIVSPPPEPLTNFTMAFDGEPVKVKLQWDVPKKIKDSDRRPGGGEYLGSVAVAGWHVFKLPFKAGQSRALQVSYETTYAGSLWSVSDDVHHSVEQFSYLFSTAAVWKGAIQSGKVVVRAAGVDADKVKFNLPKRFTRNGSAWTWEFKDFEPTLADDLKIAVHPSSQSWGRPLPGEQKDEGEGATYVDYVKDGGTWEMRHRLYKATASSTLAAQGENTYEAQNVAGQAQAWAEGAPDDGVGESLTLKLTEPRRVSRIGVRNGYMKSGDALYFANNRVAEFAISINGAKPFTAVIPDEPLRRRLFFIPLPADTPPVNTIQLAIQKVYRGTKYRDTCVSKILLATPLDKAPKITPAR